MKEFNSVFKEQLQIYTQMRKTSIALNTYLHDYANLKSFDEYMVLEKWTKKYIPEEVVNGWIKTLKGRTNTISGKVVNVRSFLRYLGNLGFHIYEPIIPKPREEYSPYIFSDLEIQQLFTEADNFVQREIHVHSLQFEISMLLRLLYSCGLRVGEALSLRIRDIDFENEVLTLKKTKRNKQRLVPVHTTLIEMLKKYCNRLNLINFNENYLFSFEDGQPLNMKFVRYYFNKFMKRCGIVYKKSTSHERGQCMHCLRHCFVFHAFRKIETEGMQITDAIPYLSTYLGHDSLYETEKYLKFSSELFSSYMEKFEIFTNQLFPEVKNEK